MKEHPLLANGNEVRAILDRGKTQLRRPITERLNGERPAKVIRSRSSANRWLMRFGTRPIMDEMDVGCPCGVPGDRLWVRETWRTLHRFNSQPVPSGTFVHYEANGGKDLQGREGRLGRFGRVRPSIHMPRWASRIILEVTDVRVERLQEIKDSFANCYAEGVYRDESSPGGWMPGGYMGAWPAFRDLWNSQAKRGYGWDRNPWVWVVEFKPREAVS